MFRGVGGILSGVRNWLAGGRVGVVAAVLAGCLALPSLWNSLQTEDHAHRVQMVWLPWFGNSFGLPGQSTWVNYYAKDTGLLPWIAVEDLRIAFWRPLASLTHKLDWSLWPQQPALMHAHSILWLVLCVAIAAAGYRRLATSPWSGGLATLLFAVDEVHGQPVGWLINRNALVATAFGLLALWAHDRWRRSDWTWGLLVAPLCLLLALLSAELGLTAAGYLLAHALILDPARWRKRIFAQLPWVAVVVGWLFTYKMLGYGTYGSGVYIDPLAEPAAFLTELPRRAGALLLGVLGVLPSQVWSFALGSWPFVIVAVLLFTWCVMVLSPLWGASPSVRFFVLGTLLSILPACTSWPLDRLLSLPSFGAMGLVASLCAAVSERRAELPRSGLWRGAAFLLASAWVFIHGVVSPLSLPLHAMAVRPYSTLVERASASAYARCRGGCEQLIVVNAIDYYFGSMIQVVRAAETTPMPPHTRVLYGGLEPLDVTRVGCCTLRLATERGYLDSPLNRVYRGPSHPLQAGQGLQLSGVQIVINRVDDAGSPLEIELRAAWPLESERFAWVVWGGNEYIRFELPRPGESKTIPAIRVEPSIRHTP